MKFAVCVLLTVMAVSLWKFTMSSVGYLYMTSHHSYRGGSGQYSEVVYKDSPDKYEPRRSFEYKILETPPLVVDIIEKILELEKETPIVENSNVIDGNSTLFDIWRHPSMKQTIQDTLLPYAEEITGEELEATALYGVREYLKGAFLAMHFDKRSTHIYSFTVTHSKDADWPLRYMKKYENDYVDVEIEAGQMLFYEGADYLHGRPSVFQGTSYMNWYMHFQPVENENSTAATW
jgi:hypothetical protein